jgi:hypothetical protein
MWDSALTRSLGVFHAKDSTLKQKPHTLADLDVELND